jgi:hypothetical protein
MTALETFAKVVQATGPARTISETEPEIAYFKDQWQYEWGYYLMLCDAEECQIMVFPQADKNARYFEIFTVPLPLIDHVAQGRAHNALCALKDRTPSELWSKARAEEAERARLDTGRRCLRNSPIGAIGHQKKTTPATKKP